MVRKTKVKNPKIRSAFRSFELVEPLSEEEYEKLEGMLKKMSKLCFKFNDRYGSRVVICKLPDMDLEYSEHEIVSKRTGNRIVRYRIPVITPFRDEETQQEIWTGLFVENEEDARELVENAGANIAVVCQVVKKWNKDYERYNYNLVKVRGVMLIEDEEGSSSRKTGKKSSKRKKKAQEEEELIIDDDELVDYE